MYVYPAKDILFTVNLKWCLNQVCDKTSPWCDLSHEFGSGLYHSQPVFFIGFWSWCSSGAYVAPRGTPLRHSDCLSSWSGPGQNKVQRSWLWDSVDTHTHTPQNCGVWTKLCWSTIADAWSFIEEHRFRSSSSVVMAAFFCLVDGTRKQVFGGLWALDGFGKNMTTRSNYRNLPTGAQGEVGKYQQQDEEDALNLDIWCDQIPYYCARKRGELWLRIHTQIPHAYTSLLRTLLKCALPNWIPTKIFLTSSSAGFCVASPRFPGGVSSHVEDLPEDMADQMELFTQIQGGLSVSRTNEEMGAKGTKQRETPPRVPLVRGLDIGIR